MKNIDGRDFMYIGGMLMLPIVFLFKNMVLYSILFLFLLLLLYFLDPIFKRFRKSVLGGNKFFITTLISGLLMGLITSFFDSYRTTLIAIWFAFSFVYGMKIAGRIDDNRAEK